MPKTIKEKKKKRRPKVPIFDLPGKGNIDPRLIRKAVVEVYGQMLREEAEARLKQRDKSVGKPSETEPE